MGAARTLFSAALVTLILGISVSGADIGSAGAVTGSDCRPRGERFSVPTGRRAVRFRVLALSAGRPCREDGGGAVEGFSIRSSTSTLFVFYRDSGGRTVADPLPLTSLVLPPGQYTLCAAPATGASVTLAWEFEPSP